MPAPQTDRKRCPRCAAMYEGLSVSEMYSCEQCGCGHLTPLPHSETQSPSVPMPRSGGGGLINHTRDNF